MSMQKYLVVERAKVEDIKNINRLMTAMANLAYQIRSKLSSAGKQAHTDLNALPAKQRATVTDVPEPPKLDE